MHAAVGGVRRRAHRRRVRDPHRRRRRARGEQLRRVARGARDDVGVAAGKAERAQRGDVGPLVRRQHRLRDSRGPRARASWRVPAAPLRAGWRRCRALRSAARLPRARPGVVVRRAGDAVEVEFGHRELAVQRSAGDSGTARTVSPSADAQRCARRRAAAESGRRAPAPSRGSRGSRRSGGWRPSHSDVVGQAVRHRVLLAERAPAAPATARTAWMSSRKHSTRRAGVEDVDVALVAEAFLLEHRARRRACRRALRRSTARAGSGSRFT